MEAEGPLGKASLTSGLMDIFLNSRDRLPVLSDCPKND